ncbi:MAG: hypothetical protein H0V70_21435 [Ktedonobacteraceae bacterium]|nr:hypothetical protein [Ktedonobacteraceae bacterium]
MSQQEMNYGEFQHGTPGTGYTGVSHDDNRYSTGSYGQKVSDRASFKTPSTGQRLALAIVSLSMLMVMTLALIAIATSINVSGSVGFMLFLVLVLFYVAVIIINVLFNRK